jgi:hypothetical protein
VSGGEIPTATWARLRDGAWGLRVQGEARTGDTVRAVRASGASALVRVGRIVWSGEGVTLCTAGDEVREPRAEAPRRRGGSRRAAPPVEAPVEAPASAEPVLVAAWTALLARAAGTSEGEAAARAHHALIEDAVGAAMLRSQIGAGEAMAREAGEAAARAHRALDALIAAGAVLCAAQTRSQQVRERGAPAPAPVAESPVQAAAEPPRAAGCRPWRRCLASGCAACAPDAPAPADGVPF